MTGAPDGAGGLRILAIFGGVVMLGAERGALEALLALKQQGAEVLLLVSDASWAQEMRDNLVALGFEIRPCPYILLRRPERRFNPLFAYPPKMLSASLKLIAVHQAFGANLLFASNQLYVLNFLPALMLLPTPLLYRCGDKPIAHNWLWRAVWRFIAARARVVVCVSRYIAEALRRSGVAADKLRIIYNRPPSRLPRSDAPGLSITPGAFNFVFMGQINQTKGVDRLIESFARLITDHPEARLLIAGRISDWEGDDWARDLRERTLRRPGLAKTVRFLGFLEDIPALLAACQVSVIPTVTDEPLGNVAIEAKAAGIPSIIFPSGGLPELITQDVDGFVCADRTVESLEQAMRSYLADPERARRQGEAARASLTSLGVDGFADQWQAAGVDAVGRGRR